MRTAVLGAVARWTIHTMNQTINVITSTTRLTTSRAIAGDYSALTIRGTTAFANAAHSRVEERVFHCRRALPGPETPLFTDAARGRGSDPA